MGKVLERKDGRERERERERERDRERLNVEHIISSDMTDITTGCSSRKSIKEKEGINATCGFIISRYMTNSLYSGTPLKRTPLGPVFCPRCL